MKRPRSMEIILATAIMSGCGQTRTLTSETESAVLPSVKAQQAASPTTGRANGQRVRFICDDGSSYSSFLTSSLGAQDNAFASRILPYAPETENELIVNLHKPVLNAVSSEKLNFIFEGSRFRDEFDSQSPIFPQIFEASFDRTTKKAEVKFLSVLPNIDREAATVALNQGMPLYQYGRAEEPSKAFVIPVNTLPIYEWYQADAAHAGRIPCPPTLCLNPQGSVDAQYVAFDRFDKSKSQFQIALFERSEDGFDFEEVVLPPKLRRSPRFMGSTLPSALAWIEESADSVLWAHYDLTTREESKRSLEKPEGNFHFSQWALSVDQKSVLLLWADEKSKVVVQSFSSESVDSESSEASFDLSSQISDEGLRIFSFAAMDRASGLLSVETLSGPRLFILEMASEQLEAVTRTNCASFTLIREEE